MIEVEKKFAMSESDIQRVLEGAEFIKAAVMIDSYYDTVDFSLTTKDWWLRERNGKFELKIPAYEGSWKDRVVDQYRELETEAEIAKEIKLKGNGFFRENLRSNGYKPFTTIQTTRRKYKKGEFGIDLDTMDFGYSISEVELIVNDEAEAKQAIDRILEFAKIHGLVVAPVRGKVLEYLKRNNPRHFELLVAAGAG